MSGQPKRDDKDDRSRKCSQFSKSSIAFNNIECNFTFCILSLSVIIEYIIATSIIYGLLQLCFDIRLLNTCNLDGFASNVNDLSGMASGGDDKQQVKQKHEQKIKRCLQLQMVAVVVFVD